jgi:L-aspartate oxidase
VVADLNGASSLPGLWVAGETACNGVMGANRLASNSLLDGMVFGPRVVEAIERGVDGPGATGAMRSVLGGSEIGGIPLELPRPGTGTVTDRDSLQRSMTLNAGVVRSAESLSRAAELCDGSVPGEDLPSWELRNLATVGRALCAGALARQESRGAHTRSDFPATSDQLRARLVIGGL